MERRRNGAETRSVTSVEVRTFIKDARGKFASIREGSGWRIELDGTALDGVLNEPGKDRDNITTSKIYINQDPDDKSGIAILDLNIYRNLHGDTQASRHYALSVAGGAVLNCSITVTKFDEVTKKYVARKIAGKEALAQTKNALQNLPGMAE